MTNLPAWVEKLKVLVDAATEGPWYLYRSPKYPSAEEPEPYFGAAAGDPAADPDFPVTGFCGGGPNSKANAAFIANARIGVPRLIALIEAQRRMIWALQEIVQTRVVCTDEERQRGALAEGFLLEAEAALAKLEADHEEG